MTEPEPPRGETAARSDGGTPAPSARDADSLDAFASGRAIPVAVGAIEKELSRFWREASTRAAQAGARLAVTRACLWNLVIRAADDEELARVKRLVDEISPVLPARVLVIAPRPEAPGSELTAWVESNARIGKGGEREICSEEVTVHAAGAGVEHVASVIRELLLPDVPTAMYWPGDPPEEYQQTARALPLMDRLVVDSGGLWNPGALGELVRLAHAYRPLELCDLGWMRARPLRAAVAGLFDPPHTEDLASLARVEIECLRHREPAGVLFLGWLAAQLHLGMARLLSPRPGEPPETTTWVLAKSRHATEVTAVLRAVDDASAPATGDLFGVTLTTSSGESCARIVAPDSADEVAVEARTPGGAHVDRSAARSPTDLFVGALGAHGCDPIYLHALSRAAEIAAAVSAPRPASSR